ncbi:MAG: hypothetical protein ACOYLX_16150 [Burkholderiaceae bacterium]
MSLALSTVPRRPRTTIFVPRVNSAIRLRDRFILRAPRIERWHEGQAPDRGLSDRTLDLGFVFVVSGEWSRRGR